MGFFSGLGNLIGSKSKVNAPPTPEYYTDPAYKSTQEFLQKYAEDMLKGQMPDYYKQIGEPVSGQIMGDYVSEATKDVLSKAMEAGAMTGRGRTGLTSDALTKAGVIGGALRYQDYVRAMQGREGLLKTGLETETGVRGAASTDMLNRNAYQQWKYGADLAREQARADQANAFRAQRWAGADEAALGAMQMYAGMSGMGGMGGASALPSSVSMFNRGAATPVSYSSYVPTSNLSFGQIAYKPSSGSQMFNEFMKAFQ